MVFIFREKSLILYNKQLVMSTINLTLYQILKTDFNLSDAKAREFIDAIREEVQNDIKYENSDFKSPLEKIS